MDKQNIEIIGRVVVKPKLEKSKSKKDYSRIRIAVNKKVLDEKNKEQDKATFYEALLFGKRAEMSQKLKKGTLIRIKGDLEVRAYLTKKGEPRTNMTVFTDEMNVFDTEIFK